MNGANDFTLEELDALFNDDQPATPPATEDTHQAGSPENGQPGNPDEKNPDQTKAFAHRLKESTEKARKEEREALAKHFGFNTYDEMLADHDKQKFESEGLDPEKVQPLVEQLVEERLRNDPRMKDLEEFRKQQVLDFGKKELAEITELTGGEITNFNQLPKDVVKLWEEKGSLKAAYLELEGEKLIKHMRSEQSKGTTSHMTTFQGTGNQRNSGTRPLTDEEKKSWRFFNPDITDEELNSKRVQK